MYIHCYRRMIVQKIKSFLAIGEKEVSLDSDLI
jgi:hypothetical protein